MTPESKHRRRLLGGIALTVVLALAAALRLTGITWGLPNPHRFYPFHPDETVIMDAVEGLHPFMWGFLPSFYNYGTLYLILCRIVIDVLAGYHLAHPFPPRLGGMPAWIDDFSRLFLIGRLVTVALAVGTVALTYA